MPDIPRPSRRARLMGLLVGRSPAQSAAPMPAAQAITPAPRADASPMPQPSVRDRLRDRMDGLRNTITGVGDDKVTAGRPDLYRYPLQPEELSALWRFGGHARRYVEVLPNDATRRGWEVQEGDGTVVDTATEDKRLQIRARVKEADTWGRLHGAAWILMITEEDLTGTPHVNAPSGVLSEPLDLSRVKRLDNLVVLEWGEASPVEYESNIRKPDYRRPVRYRISPAASGLGSHQHLAGAVVHASRMVYFAGAPLPPQKRVQNNGLDDSILQSVWDQVRNVVNLDHSLAVLASEMKITVLKMHNLADVSVSDEADYFDYRAREMAKHRSVLNTVMLAKDEDYQHHPGTVSGMGEMVNTTRQSLQAVTGMPEQLWIGSAPGGLSTDGESHRNLWANVVASYQEVKIKPCLDRLYEVMFAAKEGPWKGVAPDGWAVDFRPLDEITQTADAALRKTVAETDAIYIAAGVLDPQHVAQGRFGDRGWQYELPPVDSDSFSGGAELDMGAVLAALADPSVGGLPPIGEGDPSGGAAPDDGDLADRRRLAAAMTDAGVVACEHGSKNRCRLCGVERRRHFEASEDGTGEPVWAVRWAPIGDYEEGDAAPPKPAPALPRAAGLMRMLAERSPQRDSVNRSDALVRLPGAPAPEGHTRADADTDGVSVWIGVPLPEAARPAWDAARLEAATLLGVTMEELDDRGYPPHVTVLWVGKVPQADVAAMRERVTETLNEALGPITDITEDGARMAAHRALDLHGYGLGAFSPTPASDGDTPVYISLGGEALHALHRHLAEALLEDDEREARAWFHAHATLGYLPAELTMEQWEALWFATSGKGKWTANTVELRIGRELVNTWSLAERST